MQSNATNKLFAGLSFFQTLFSFEIECDRPQITIAQNAIAKNGENSSLNLSDTSERIPMTDLRTIKILEGDLQKKMEEMRNNAPYSYGNDAAIAQLNISCKEEQANFPIISLDKSKIVEMQNNEELNKMIIDHKYKDFIKVEGYSDSEKMLFIYLTKIELYLELLDDKKVERGCYYDCGSDKKMGSGYSNCFFIGYQYYKNAHNNISTYVKKITGKDNVDLYKLNLIIYILVSLSEFEGYTAPGHDFSLLLENVQSLKNADEFEASFEQFVAKNGFQVSSKMKDKISMAESVKYFPLMTKSGLFGCNTFLKLFFNEMIPYAASIRQVAGRQISVHNGERAGGPSVIEHDIEHGLRSFKIMKNKNWFNYLKFCYNEILTNEIFVDSQNLIFYLLFIINEIGMIPENAKQFVNIIETRFSLNTRIEYDDSFISMLQQAFGDDVKLEEQDKRAYAIDKLSLLHNLFHKYFRIQEIDEETDLEILQLQVKRTLS
jgi:hypothetical protein